MSDGFDAALPDWPVHFITPAEAAGGQAGVRLAVRATPGDPTKVGVMWLGGFYSDMKGGKARALHAAMVSQARACVRFDYAGHGESAGAPIDGAIGRWLGDALAVLDACSEGPQILVGSSMGGWLALLAALARPDRVAGLVLIAPAPDFTERLMWATMGDEARAAIMTEGVWMRPSPYSEPQPITRAFIEEAREHLLLGSGESPASVAITVPVRILHGLGDVDVPPALSHELMTALTSDDVEATFIKAGDHRLSEPGQIALLVRTVSALAQRLDP